jgi:hypothetical protein
MYPILGKHWLNYKHLIDKIIPNLKVYTYSFVPEDKFRKLIKSFPAEGMRIYWDEILYRAHYAAIITILRSHKWAEGVQSSYEKINYLSFCANLRGLLESGADSFESTAYVPKTIATVFEHIPMVRCPDLENMLIHFSHGRYIKKGEVVPAAHEAKSIFKYLKSFDPKDNRRFLDLYGELCETTHPAAPSVHMFLTPIDNEGDVIALSDSNDALLIQVFMERFQNVIDELIDYTFTPPLITLRVLNYFKNPKIATPAVEDINLAGVKLWRDCKALLQKQQIK